MGAWAKILRRASYYPIILMAVFLTATFIWRRYLVLQPYSHNPDSVQCMPLPAILPVAPSGGSLNFSPTEMTLLARQCLRLAPVVSCKSLPLSLNPRQYFISAVIMLMPLAPVM